MKQEAQSPGVCTLWLLKPVWLPAGAVSAHAGELGDCTPALTAALLTALPVMKSP